MNRLKPRIRLYQLLAVVTLSAIGAHALFSPFYPKTSLAGFATALESGGRKFELTIKNDGVLPIWYNGDDGASVQFVNDPRGIPHVHDLYPSSKWTILWPGDAVKLSVQHGHNPNEADIAIGARFKNWSGRTGHSFTTTIPYGHLGKLKCDAQHYW